MISTRQVFVVLLLSLVSVAVALGDSSDERTPDEYPHAGLPAEEAAAAMKLPPGFSVTAAAAEPDVQQPIAMAIDDRGRIWIAEAYEYPIRANEGEGRDRILIFEDTTGDGRLDSRKVFAEGLNLVSGLEVGFDGVWVGAAPYFLFIPDRDHDDVPDGEPEILLDGWGYEDTHETLNAFIWGPDGWLYGCHGVFTHSRVGKPGTPDEERIPLNAAIWRYHPTRHEFEVFAHGTSNPWGVDFNDHGQAFCTACVIPHLFHIIQGARYHRQAGRHFNPYTYNDIKTIADHRHYLGSSPHGGNDNSDSAGGGHAHAGAMIYLGGSWPPEYRNQIFMNNIHGQRINMDVLKPHGSGFVGSHGPDFLLTGDRASQILNLRYGPDGQVTMIDWYDMQACHLHDPEAHDRSNGRIYKIAYGQPKHVRVDLKGQSDMELAKLVLHENDWYVRHARRILQERAASGDVDSMATGYLKEIAQNHADDTRRLRALWALYVTDRLGDDLRDNALLDESPYVRGWAIQLATQDISGEELGEVLLSQLISMAENDPSPVVRLYLAAAAQKIPIDQRWSILESLTRHTADAGDHNLPLMIWYAAEPLADVDVERALAWANEAGKAMPQLQEFMFKRIGSSDQATALELLVGSLGQADNTSLQLTHLRALLDALSGRYQVPAPAGWSAVYDSIYSASDERTLVLASFLGAIFGQQKAVDNLYEFVGMETMPTNLRRQSLSALLSIRDPNLADTLLELLADPSLRSMAIRGLARYEDPRAAEMLLGIYGTLGYRDKQAALSTLCARVDYARKLLESIGAGQIESADLTADLARQLRQFGDERVDEHLKQVWGTFRETNADKRELISKYRNVLRRSGFADPSLGRTIFAKTCQRCHKLFGQGDTVGPDITGSNRGNMEYLLNNIVDPSAVMAKEYQQSTIFTDDGRVITGIVQEDDGAALKIRTADETLVLAKDDIEERVASDKSMMPEDQLRQFTNHEVRSLVAYLQSREQVPMLATAENASELFNGEDLTGWSGRADLWSVEDGEIIGESSGLEKNEFLVSDMASEDFKLTLEVKLVDDNGNSGIQFRSEAHEGEVAGYQADVGPDWWGDLYDEHGRGLLAERPPQVKVNKGDWNLYEIVAEGDHVQTYLNGQLCVDLYDPEGRKRGVFALQIHSGGPTEVRFRKLKLEVLETESSENR